jgi:hypothetical protein
MGMILQAFKHLAEPERCPPNVTPGRREASNLGIPRLSAGDSGFALARIPE